MSTRTRTLEEMRITVENARKVGWFTDESASTMCEIIRRELLRALREEGDVKLRGKKVAT